MKKKILFFISTMLCGGAETALISAVKRLPKDKYEFTVVSLLGGGGMDALPPCVHCKTIIRTKNRILKHFQSWMAYRMIPPALFARLFLKGAYDTAIAYSEGFPTKVIAKFKSCGAKIAFVHCGMPDSNLRPLGFTSSKKCMNTYKVFSKVCFVSNDAKQNFDKVTGGLPNTCVMYNIIDVDGVLKKASASADVYFNTSGTRIVSVGRLAAVKGFERLIRAAGELEKKYQFQLIIVGDGEKREELSDLIGRLKIQSVRLIGFRENPYAIFNQADFYVCSSYSEGYSTAVIEALILGLPVLTTKCSGMNELLQNGRFGMITDNSLTGLKDGLERMLQNDLYASYKNEVAAIDPYDFLNLPLLNYTALLDEC